MSELTDYDKLWIVFRKVDTSNDGKVTRNELAEACKGAATLSSQQARDLMKFADEDDDGSKFVAFPAFYRALQGKQLDPRVTPSLLKNFADLDFDRDGYVTRADLSKGVGMSPKHQEKLFATADANKDGKVSLSEYVGAFAAVTELALTPMDEQKLRQQFAVLDLNGDGYVSKNELKKAAKLINLDNPKFLKTMQKADLDGDGQISFEEFVTLMF
jgi:Ca2+-binding EF-hand superfamily protein